MYVLLSPAKKLNEGPSLPSLPATQPALLDQTRQLMKVTRRLKANDPKELMHISDALAELNVQRFADFEMPFTPDNARQAVLSFAGDVYVGLDADSLDADDHDFAQQHLGILSGLYGLLRPLDLMQPYRLEMGTSLKTRRGSTLYAFWGDRLGKAVRKAALEAGDGTIVNLASNEYFKAVDKKALKGCTVITPVFQDVKDGKARTISFFAKKARGAMARHIVQQRLTDAQQLQSAQVMGYRFDDEASTPVRWVFRRPQPPPVR